MSTQELKDDDPDIAMLRVLREDGGADSETDPRLASEVLLRGYREMRRLRLLDARMISLQRQGRIGYYGGARGQEAVPVAAALALREEDWVFPALREQGVMLARGFPLRAFIAQVLGNSGDALKGRQMPSHTSARAVRQVSCSSCVGPQLPQAVGAAWAMRRRGAGAIAIAFCGDGATSQADFHAAMNFAGVWRVPCVIVCQNDHGSISVPTARQTASRTLAIKARAYGIPGVRVDGNDFLASFAVLRDAFDRARAGGGPTFVEAVTYALVGVGTHSTSDDPAMYRWASEAEAWAGKDPLDRLRKHLLRMGLLTDAADAALEEEISAEIRAAVTEAEPLPPVDPASLFGDVYAELPWHLREQLQVLKVLKVGRQAR